MQAVKSCVGTDTPVSPAHCSDLSASGLPNSFFIQNMEEPALSLALRNRCVCQCVFLCCVYCIHRRPVMVCMCVYSLCIHRRPVMVLKDICVKTDVIKPPIC